MWMVFDIGNSAIKGGAFDAEHLERTFEVPHDASKMMSALDSVLGWQKDEFERVGIASVVPRSSERLAGLLAERGLAVTIVHHAMKLPFDMAYHTPETLGTDRLAAAAAAWELHGRPNRAVVALDAGTAFTYEVVDRAGVYRGGTIAPGPALMRRALNRETAQLPDVPLELPDGAIGRSTVEAIQSGVMYGFIESVRGLLRRINDALGEDAYVVATGGWSRMLRDHLDEVHANDDHLVLRGVRILMSLNP